jgi:hypothetical protein
MENLTRLQACKKIRRETLLTAIQGEQLIGYEFRHEFTVRLMYRPNKKQLLAVFNSTHTLYQYSVPVTWKQVLRFIRQYYPKH